MELLLIILINIYFHIDNKNCYHNTKRDKENKILSRNEKSKIDVYMEFVLALKTTEEILADALHSKNER